MAPARQLQQASGSAPAPAPSATAPANITVVRTGPELQQATLSGAQDIEIRAHLDMRDMHRIANPLVKGVDYGQRRKEQAVLYASRPLRSIRGNCEDPDVAGALGLSNAEASALVPLKPFQCLVLIAEPWLMVNNGEVWLDNVHLQMRRTLVQPIFWMISAGASNGAFQDPITGSDIYATNVTFQAEQRGTAMAMVADVTGVSVYVEDCIIADWASFRSPFSVKFQSVFHIRNTLFLNSHISAELVDVSQEGVVHMHNVSLANVTLDRGAIVSTTLNDYQQAIGYIMTYYADDDEAFDVPVEVVPIAERGVFGAEFVVVNSTLGDCVYLLADENVIEPGCPPESVARREEMKERAAGRAVPFEVANIGAPLPAPAYAEPYDYPVAGEEDLGGILQLDAEQMEYYLRQVDPSLWFYDRFLTRDWIDSVQQELPSRPLPPDSWRPLTFKAPPPANRTSVRPSAAVLPPETAKRILGPINITACIDAERAAAASGGDGLDAAAIGCIALTAIALALAAALFALWSQRPSKQYPPCSARAIKSKEAMLVCFTCGSGAYDTSNSGALQEERDWSRPQSCTETRQRLAGSRVGDTCSVCQAHTDRGSRALMWQCARGSGADCDITLPPAPLMNPGYEYILPRHLALYEPPRTRSSCSETSAAMVKTGSTVVVAPYTVSTADGGHAAPTSASTHAGDDADLAPPRSAIWTHHRPGFKPDAQEAVESSPATRHDLMQLATGQRDGLTATGRSQALPVPPLQQLKTVHEDDGKYACDESPAAGTGRLTPQRLVLPLAVSEDAPRSTTGTAAGEGLGRRLQWQLDTFTTGDRFLGRFEMLGRRHRRCGGQAVVQFAQSRRDRCEFAVKFFLDWPAFLTEAALYAAAFPSMRSATCHEVIARADAVSRLISQSGTAFRPQEVSKFLPQVEAVCDGASGGLVDPRGRPLPPCIVMERGESLQDLCNRAEPDIFCILAVLSHISSRLAVMHALGYVHRDLKPANIMWLPRQNRWTVIDFGCVARVGEEAPLSFTLAYAAPEVVEACRERRRSIEAQPALDAWSLGVTAFELLTGAPAFDLLSHGRGKVMSMLGGQEALPWEGELSGDVRRKLGLFRGPVLQLLERDPRRRSSLEAFHTSCTRARLFSSEEEEPT